MIGTEVSREVMLIDPVIEHINDYARKIATEGLTLTMVLDTHTHADHISGRHVRL